MLFLGIALDQIIFPRTKIINVQDDYVETQKVKDNSKHKGSTAIVDKEGGTAQIAGDMTRREVLKVWKSIKFK